MASIKDIAQKSGVSPSTVSRFLNGTGYVSKSAKARIQKAIKELNYTPNAIARSLVTKKSNIIGLLIPHIKSPFFSGLGTSVEEEARKLGYNVLLCHTDENTEMEREYLKILMERRVDGIIVTPVGIEYSHFEQLIGNIPVIFAARCFNNLDISSVVADNVGGSFKVIEHLIQLGHKRIGIVNGPLAVSTAQERWNGAIQAFNKYGIEIDMDIVKEGNFNITGGYSKALEILGNANPPTAIYAANHLTALGVLKALNEKKIPVPEQIALASFDGLDDMELTDIITPAITANVHPTREMGITAVDLLHEQIRDKASGNMRNYTAKSIIIKTHLVIRESTIGLARK